MAGLSPIAPRRRPRDIDGSSPAAADCGRARHRAANWGQRLLAALLFSTLLPVCNAGTASEARVLRVLVEDLDYRPFHDFSGAHASGFVVELLRDFAARHHYTLHFTAMPIKRLARARAQAEKFDLAYPDNPDWHPTDQAPLRHFSAPLAHIIGGTMVLPENVDLRREDFKVLSLPRGFTPFEWLALIEAGEVSVLEAPDAAAALDLVFHRRADGADIEYNVARALLQRQARDRQLVLGRHLPIATTAFHASADDAELIAQLDRYLAEHAQALAELRRRHGIVDSAAAALGESESASAPQ